MDKEEILSASSSTTRPLLKNWVRPSLSLVQADTSQAAFSASCEIETSRTFLQPLETTEGFWENADALKTPSDLAGVFERLDNFFVIPVISPCFTTENGHKTDLKRGNYKCGLCGQMKNKHRCPYGPWQKHCETQVDLALTSWGEMYPSLPILQLFGDRAQKCCWSSMHGSVGSLCCARFPCNRLWGSMCGIIYNVEYLCFVCKFRFESCGVALPFS